MGEWKKHFTPQMEERIYLEIEQKLNNSRPPFQIQFIESHYITNPLQWVGEVCF